jgi:hypothetical protein
VKRGDGRGERGVARTSPMQCEPRKLGFVEVMFLVVVVVVNVTIILIIIFVAVAIAV